MATPVKIPSLGESITSGILAAWHVKDGDTVEAEQILYELETDKITQEGLAETGGVISIKVEEGEEVEIGQVIAEIDESATGSTQPASDEAPAEATPPAKPAEPQPAEVQSPVSGKFSPAVRRVAEETGIDPSQVSGSGKGGRVTKKDMLAAADKVPDTPAPAPKSPAPPAPKATSTPTAGNNEERVTRRKMTPLRKRIAERLVMAQHEAAILTTFNECDMGAIMKLRKQHQESFVKQHGVKLGFMSFFVKAAVHALKAVPQMNAQIEGDMILENNFFDIGVAIGTERGLIVPVLRDVDQKGFAEIENDILAYAQKAKEGKISIDDLSGGVFTISNGGVYGSLLSTPIINPPQSGILGMHSIQQRPVALNGEVVIRPMMYLAVSYDHRLVDGKEAVTFLVKIKEAIEDPTRLLFEI